MLEGMHGYKVILTWEAIYDVTDIADYIEDEFGQDRADRFQNDIKKEMEKLGYIGGGFTKTKILYRNYTIHKKTFPPSIFFYILMDEKQEVHVLRVLREERNWQNILKKTKGYTYPI